LIGTILFVNLSRPFSDTDFFWHLKTGEWIWQHQALPTADPFAYPTPATLDARQRFTLTSYWLSQIAYHLLAPPKRAARRRPTYHLSPTAYAV
jgi:hypothetical protein